MPRGASLSSTRKRHLLQQQAGLDGCGRRADGLYEESGKVSTGMWAFWLPGRALLRVVALEMLAVQSCHRLHPCLGKHSLQEGLGVLVQGFQCRAFRRPEVCVDGGDCHLAPVALHPGISDSCHETAMEKKKSKQLPRRKGDREEAGGGGGGGGCLMVRWHHEASIKEWQLYAFAYLS